MNLEGFDFFKLYIWVALAGSAHSSRFKINIINHIFEAESSSIDTINDSNLLTLHNHIVKASD